MDFNIVAVTACVSGVAHTYMAAERLEKVGHHEKWHLKVETQGARRRKSDHRGRYRPRRSGAAGDGYRNRRPSSLSRPADD